MNPIKRRKHILDELNKFGEVTVIKLSEMLNVTSEPFVAISPYWNLKAKSLRFMGAQSKSKLSRRMRLAQE